MALSPSTRIVDALKKIVMIATPVGLVVFSVSHTALSWSETQHLHEADVDEWIQHLTNIQGRWLAAHMGGVALFPLLGLTVWWMLPRQGIASVVSKIALAIYVPVYVAVDAVLGIGSAILVDYRQRLAPEDRPGADGALEALFFEPSAVDWLDRCASLTWEIGLFAAAAAMWRTHGWRVSIPLAATGWFLAQSHFPPDGAIAGATLGLAVWQYLTLNSIRNRRPAVAAQQQHE